MTSCCFKARSRKRIWARGNKNRTFAYVGIVALILISIRTQLRFIQTITESNHAVTVIRWDVTYAHMATVIFATVPIFPFATDSNKASAESAMDANTDFVAYAMAFLKERVVHAMEWSTFAPQTVLIVAAWIVPAMSGILIAQDVIAEDVTVIVSLERAFCFLIKEGETFIFPLKNQKPFSWLQPK